MDDTIIENAFQIKAGSIYEVAMKFSPDLSSSLRPGVNLTFVN